MDLINYINSDLLLADTGVYSSAVHESVYRVVSIFEPNKSDVQDQTRGGSVQRRPIGHLLLRARPRQRIKRIQYYESSGRYFIPPRTLTASDGEDSTTLGEGSQETPRDFYQAREDKIQPGEFDRVLGKAVDLPTARGATTRRARGGTVPAQLSCLES